MLWLYRILFPLGLLLGAPGYLWRMRRRGGYAENFFHRFGGHPRLPPVPPGGARIWLQAVSVGEMLAIGGLLEALKKDGVGVYLTTTTSTGFRLARERYGNLAEGIGYFPLDAWPYSVRAWNRIAPTVAVLMEGERWPEHLAQARRRGVPVVAINARLSDRSYNRLRIARRLCPGLPGLLFGSIDRLLAGSHRDEQRFRELGFPAERMQTVGNLKLDVSIPALSGTDVAALKRELGVPAGLILFGSSTWPGEEEALVAALQEARAAGVDCRLVLVPRHAERRGEIEQLLQGGALSFHFRGRGSAPLPVDVAVGDTTGELRRLVQVADVVFVGKSLPPHTEGQTPVEAAALEKPILFGPGMSNFAAIAEDLLGRGAAEQVADRAELTAAVVELLEDEAARRQLAAAAHAWREENRGAGERTLQVLREEIARRWSASSPTR